MKRYRKLWFSFTAALLCLLALPLQVRAEDPLLKNEELAGEGIPESWEVRSYLKEAYDVSADGGEVTLTSYEANDLRLCQTLTVEENTAYVFSAQIAHWD